MSFLICCFLLPTDRPSLLSIGALHLWDCPLGCFCLRRYLVGLVSFRLLPGRTRITFFLLCASLSALLSWKYFSFGTISLAGAVTEGVSCAKEVPWTQDAPANRLLLVGLRMSFDFAMNETPPWLSPKSKSLSNRGRSKAFPRTRARNVPEN